MYIWRFNAFVCQLLFLSTANVYRKLTAQVSNSVWLCATMKATAVLCFAVLIGKLVGKYQIVINASLSIKKPFK